MLNDAVFYPDGRQMWYQHDQLHRDNDLPAVVYPDGTRIWYQYGKIHRGGDLPAIVYADGIQEWYQHDKLHRTSGPACIDPNGYQEWWVRGEETKFRKLCEQACTVAHTEEEKHFLSALCLHDDPVVAAVAAHNLSCPEEGKVIYCLKH